MKERTLATLRLRRHGLLHPARTEEEYDALFRLLQPVPPVYFTSPGDPPRLAHRVAFDDMEYNRDHRAQRNLVKGRFLGGTVGYVLADELELYACACRKEIDRLNPVQQRVYDAVRSAGPLTIPQIKEETGLLAKEITPTLLKLQEAFLVFEDQNSDDWERSWYVFERVWEEVDLRRWPREQAVGQVLMRFLQANVFACEAAMKSWSRLSAKDIRAAVALLTQRGDIVAVDGSQGRGYVRAEDMTVLGGSVPQTPPTVFSLHRADPLVRAQEHLLKGLFPDAEVLQYVLVDGQFRGAACGHWRFAPYDVEDILLTLDPQEQAARRDAILAAVADQYPPPRHNILKYGGVAL